MSNIEIPRAKAPLNSRTLRAWPNVALLGCVAILFAALRLLEEGTMQRVLLGVAALAYGVAVAGRVVGRRDNSPESRSYLLTAALADVLVLIGGICAAAAVVLGGDHDTLGAVGLVGVCAGTALVVALEVTAAEMRATGFIDVRRVHSATRTAATLIAGAVMLFAGTYAIEKLDVRADLAFKAPTAPSAATLSVLDAAQCGDDKARPEIFLFFGRGSDALIEVRDYFAALKARGAAVTEIDQALDPALAKDLKASRNGTIAFRCAKRTESYFLGDDRDGAQKKVGKLDEEMRTRLAKITKDPLTVYATVGHGERSLDESQKGNERLAAKALRQLLEQLNAKTKKLGIADGLTQSVPADAAVVAIIGPTTAFLPEEAASLAAYVNTGGAVMLLLDPPAPGAIDVAVSLQPLLTALGVKLPAHEVLNDKAFIRQSNTAADHAFLYASSFGSHKSVKTLSGARGKAALLFLTAQSVDKLDPKADGQPGKPKVSLTVRSQPQSFIDVNDSRAFEDPEARAIVDLAAAVEIEPAQPTEGAKQGRALVVGDSDIAADLLLQNDANKVFLYDALLWLTRDEDKGAGGIESDEDIPIRHTRDEDTLWFYGSSLGAPLLILAIGVVVVRRRRRRGASSSASAASGSPPPSSPSPLGGAA